MAKPMPAELTICICTRNRPADLQLALESVAAAWPAVAAVVVADDSTDDRTADLVANQHPHVSYVRGPLRGLGANRNAAISRVWTSHLAFIDDDARLDPKFVLIWREALAALPSQRQRVILTGAERKADSIIQPKAPTFLGHQSRSYRFGEPLYTVVINATVFPSDLFDEIRFDECLVYGSDEIDIAMQAVAHGYHILWTPGLVNDHFPSPVNRDYYAGHAEAARIYVAMKRYSRIERSFVKAGIFLFVGPGHLMVHAVRRHGLVGLLSAARTISQVCQMFLRSRRPIAAHQSVRAR